MSNDLKFSVITVSYNQGPYIRDNIESVLNQNYSNFEHIIIDAGSTDETLSIIKEYDHLNWVSEPDRGQSDGLNKGFRKATGDVIAWLNSDDYYAPDIFNYVAKELQKYPIVLGQCQVIDDNKNPVRLVSNIERNYFDLLKYWINDASPAQQSIFFKKEVLDKVSYPKQNYLSEKLHYAMDLDLWLRMAENYEFTKRTDKVLSYFRFHEGTKTGGNHMQTLREFERVFMRHENMLIKPDVDFSIVIPIKEFSQSITDTLASIAAQNYHKFEIVLVNTADKQNYEVVKALIDEIVNNIKLKFVKKIELVKEDDNLSSVIDICSSKYIGIVYPGDELDTDYVQSTINSFNMNTIGIVLPRKYRNEETECYTKEDEIPISRLNLEALLKLKYLNIRMAIRKIAFKDILSMYQNEISLNTKIIELVGMITWILHKGWQVCVDEAVGIKVNSYFENNKYSKDEIELETIKLIAQIGYDIEKDKFAVSRIEQGLSLNLEANLLKNSKNFVESLQPHSS